jgi:hypothetical protein
MTTVLGVPPSDIRSGFTMNQAQDPSRPQNIKQESEPDRGRHGSRSQEIDEKGAISDNDQDAEGDLDAKNGNSSNSDTGPARKRRRSRKGLDKKFECPTVGCGKSYSRAEHLYRHQLNHTPKVIYHCEYPDCDRTFVRLDLKNRHQDRHTAKGSALSRKDSMNNHGTPMDSSAPHYTVATGSLSPETNRPGSSYQQVRPSHVSYQTGAKGTNGGPYTPVSATPPTAYSHNGPPTGVDTYMHNDSPYHNDVAQAHQSPTGPPRPTLQTSVPPYSVMSPASTHHSAYPSQPTNTPQSAYVAQQNFPPFSLPPSDFTPATANRDSGHPYAPPPSATPTDYNDTSHQQASGEMMLLDQMANQTTIPVFGSDGVLNKSPYISIPEDFVAYLFNTNQPDASPTLSHVLPPYARSVSSSNTSGCGTDKLTL